MPYLCNICDTQVSELDRDTRSEGSPCPGCDSNIRLRAVARLVSEALFGKTLPLSAFPKNRPISALGISDAIPFAYCMRRAIPGTADVITCREVLEHVEPPVQPAFDGLFSLLKPGGTLVLTVPSRMGRTVEHFPDLHEWHLESRRGKRVLINRTRDGQPQEFENLVFHGGGDAVLEMRVGYRAAPGISAGSVSSSTPISRPSIGA